MTVRDAGRSDGAGQSIADVGEFGLIDLITAGLRPSGPVLLGVGDDAAVRCV